MDFCGQTILDEKMLSAAGWPLFETVILLLRLLS